MTVMNNSGFSMSSLIMTPRTAPSTHIEINQLFKLNFIVPHFLPARRVPRPHRARWATGLGETAQWRRSGRAHTI
jgi:hypothetical protein